MDDLIYDILCRQADNIGIIVCKSEKLEFFESRITSYEFRGEFVVSITATDNGKEIIFRVIEKQYGELVYNVNY